MLGLLQLWFDRTWRSRRRTRYRLERNNITDRAIMIIDRGKIWDRGWAPRFDQIAKAGGIRDRHGDGHMRRRGSGYGRSSGRIHVT